MKSGPNPTKSTDEPIPEPVLVEGDLARQSVGRTIPHVPHVVDDPLSVPPLAPSLHAVDRHRVEAAHATEVVERLGQNVDGVVHEDVVRLLTRVKFYYTQYVLIGTG